MQRQTTRFAASCAGRLQSSSDAVIWAPSQVHAVPRPVWRKRRPRGHLRSQDQTWKAQMVPRLRISVRLLPELDLLNLNEKVTQPCIRSASEQERRRAERVLTSRRATCSRLLRGPDCRAGHRLDPDKMVAHTFNAGHILSCEDKRSTFSLIEKSAPKFDRAVAHDDVDQTERRPALPIQFGQQALTNRFIVGRRGFDLPAQACQRMNQIGATDNSNELAVTQDRQAFDAMAFHQLDDVTQRRV